MIILPYIRKTTSVNNITVISYTILTIGGTMLWSEDSLESLHSLHSVINILEQNDIKTESVKKIDDIYLCSVDSTKTVITDFYKWSEITDPDTFCWRTLYVFTGNKSDKNWLPHPNESIGKYTYETLCSILSV